MVLIPHGKSAVTYRECDAREACATIIAHVPDMDLASAVRTLSRAYKHGTAAVGRVLIIHTGYVRNPVHYDAGTAVYRLVISRAV